LDTKWQASNIEISIVPNRKTNSSEFNGEHDHQRGVIKFVDAGSRKCTVELNSSGKQLSVPFEALEPSKPTRQDNIMILSGEVKGQKGTLIGYENDEAIVELNQYEGLRTIDVYCVGKVVNN
jgi:transcription elongation factor SPT5